MSNFFAALGDSDNEDDKPKITQKTSSKAPSKPLEPSKPDRKAQYNHDSGDRHTKGGRGHRGGGKRQFDRRSGTGRGKDVKKGGGGGRNWGNDKNEARKNEGPIDESQLQEGEKGAEAEDEAPREEEPEPEPEDNTMSYEDYLAAKQKPDSEAFAETKLREVDNEFAGLSMKGKGEEEDFLVMGGGKQKRTRQKKDEKKTVDVSFRVVDSSAAGNDRRGGGRGRGRGDRRDSGGRGGGRSGGRGGSRGGRGGRGGRGRGGRGGRSINMTDPEAFPSL